MTCLVHTSIVVLAGVLFRGSARFDELQLAPEAGEPLIRGQNKSSDLEVQPAAARFLYHSFFSFIFLLLAVMASSPLGDNVFEQLRKPIDPKELEKREKDINDRVHASYEKAEKRQHELVCTL